MGKSIRTTSNTQNPPTLAINQATFAIGDLVLCPSLSNSPFVLTADPYGKRNNLTLEFEGSYFYYDDKGYFVPACDKETGDFQPSLYHNTPANQQAINMLYGNTSNTQTSQRKVIDTTTPDDNEVILISSHDLSDIACDIESAAIVISDIGQLLGLIHYEKIDNHIAISMARLTHDATVTWYDLLQSQLSSINDTLAMTRYGKEGK